MSFNVLSAPFIAAAVVFLPLVVACGSSDTSDASIGKNANALGSELKEGDLCPPEKCESDQFACAEAPIKNPTNVRCVAGPQKGSGVGVCFLDGECK